MAQAVISEFLASKRIAIQDKQCPWKQAPPSPKNIFPQGKFSKNKPKELKKKIKQSKTTSASAAIQAITVKKNEVDKEIPSDNPFNPSTRLKEWATPVVANIVKSIAKGERKKSWSKNNTSTFVNQVSNNKIAQMDEIEAPNNRQSGFT